MNTQLWCKFLMGGVIALASASTLADVATPLPDVAPTAQGQHVVINIPQLRLFLYDKGRLQKIYPIAVGKNLTQTPLGEYKIGGRAFNPTWTIPKSIQAERARKGLLAIKSVPAGPENPLGPVFVRFGDPKLGLGIHGTNAPASVPGVRSHGCVRMKSDNALTFAKTIHTGSQVTVAYQLAALNADAQNNLWLVAWQDPYGLKNLKLPALRASMKEWAAAHKLTVNDKTVAQILKNKSGKAYCITCAKQPAAAANLRALRWQEGQGELVTPRNDDIADSAPVTTEPDVEAFDQEKSKQEKSKEAKPERTARQPAAKPVRAQRAASSAASAKAPAKNQRPPMTAPEAKPAPKPVTASDETMELMF